MKLRLANILLSLFALQFFDDGVGRFDSVGGTYDENTSFSFGKQIYYTARPKCLFANVPNAVRGAFETTGTVGAIIDRVKINEGDMVRFTLQDHITGMPGYGDQPVRAGGFLAFKNMEARVNNIDSPAIQIVGKMSQQRVRQSIANLPASTRKEVTDWCAVQTEFEAISAFLQGASPSVMTGTSDGGLGVSLGIGSGAGAGVPLMNKHWFTPDTGFITYNTTPATHNYTVDDAIYGIDSSSNDQFTYGYHLKIRSYMDEILMEPVTWMGQQLKSVAFTDPEIMWRLAKTILADVNKYQMPRGKENPFWNSRDIIILDEIAYISCPYLKKYRPTAVGTGDNSGTSGPAFGPLTAKTDPRTYTTTSTNGLVIYAGAGALKEGFNDSIDITEEYSAHRKSLEIAGHFMQGFVRGEFYAKDGRTASADSVENRSVICAAFNEPGVGEDDDAEA